MGGNYTRRTSQQVSLFHRAALWVTNICPLEIFVSSGLDFEPKIIHTHFLPREKLGEEVNDDIKVFDKDSLVLS